MSGVAAVFKRELASYFATPIAYVFIVIFLVIAGSFTFFFGGFYEANQADLSADGGFFYWHPWLYLFLVPALSMRLWSEERKSGSIELLMTLPVTLPQAVLGKFLAAWLFAGAALVLTFPTWITINYLGDPDNGTILAGYVGSFLMAGGFLGTPYLLRSIETFQSRTWEKFGGSTDQRDEFVRHLDGERHERANIAVAEYVDEVAGYGRDRRFDQRGRGVGGSLARRSHHEHDA